MERIRGKKFGGLYFFYGVTEIVAPGMCALYYYFRGVC